MCRLVYTASAVFISSALLLFTESKHTVFVWLKMQISCYSQTLYQKWAGLLQTAPLLLWDQQTKHLHTNVQFVNKKVKKPLHAQKQFTLCCLCLNVNKQKKHTCEVSSALLLRKFKELALFILSNHTRTGAITASYHVFGGDSHPGSVALYSHPGLRGSCGPLPCSFFTSISLLRRRASRIFPNEPLLRRPPLPSWVHKTSA